MTCISSTALLLGHVSFARAAVFEELRNGTMVQMNSGLSATVPPAYATPDQSSGMENTAALPPAALAGYLRKEQPDPARSTGAVLLDLPTSAFPQTARTTMRQPRALPTGFSQQRQQMRLLAAEIGLSFANHPGVVRAGLDETSFVDLFITMIHRESNFDPTAVSPAGAGGLGQLMPGTAREFGVCNVFSARENLQGSAQYLTSMLDQFGSPELALAAYNAGPGAVRKYRGIPPYSETQHYVADILQAVARKSDTHKQIIDTAQANSRIGEGYPVSAYLEITTPQSRMQPRCDSS